MNHLRKPHLCLGRGRVAPQPKRRRGKRAAVRHDARRPVRDLPGRSDAAERGLRGREAAGGGRLQVRCAGGADLLRPAGLERGRRRGRGRTWRGEVSMPSRNSIMSSCRRAPAPGCSRNHYPEALAGDPAYAARARALAAKTHELVSFLVHERGMDHVLAQMRGARPAITIPVRPCARWACRTSRASFWPASKA